MIYGANRARILTFFLYSLLLGLFDFFKQGLLPLFLELSLEEFVLALLNLHFFRRHVRHSNRSLFELIALRESWFNLMAVDSRKTQAS